MRSALKILIYLCLALGDVLNSVVREKVIIMHPATLASIEELRSLTWFNNVGTDKADDRVVWVNSWGDAVRSCQSSEWDFVRSKVLDGFEAQLRRVAPLEWQRWDKVATQIGPVVNELVEQKTSLLQLEDCARVNVIRSVHYDIFSFAIECEFSEILPCGFFTGLSYFYSIGRFPCGWQGEMPPRPGRYMIF